MLWLAIRGRVWTNDRLAKRGLPQKAACCFCHNAQQKISSSFHRMLGRADNLEHDASVGNIAEVAPGYLASHSFIILWY